MISVTLFLGKLATNRITRMAKTFVRRSNSVLSIEAGFVYFELRNRHMHLTPVTPTGWA